MKSKVIAHVDMDAFFAAVEELDNPEIKGKPVVVGADPKGGRGRGVVSTCSYAARKYGIHSAMPISKAYQLCPQAIFLPGRGKRYSEISRQIFKIFYDFTPDIEPISIDEAFLDVTHSYHLFGSPLQTGEKIKSRIKDDIGITASIGIAPNKMVAKIASDFCKPDGLLEIKKENMLEFLWALPVEKIWGVGPKTKQILNRFGIIKIEDLAKTPVDFLNKELGENGIHLFNLANGIDEREVNKEDDDSKSVSHEHTFDSDTDNKDEIYQILSYLSEKVSRRLRKLGLKGKTLTLKFRTSDFKTITRASTFDENINFFETIFSKSKYLFDDIFKENMKCRLIGIKMSNFKENYFSGGLFNRDSVEKKESVHKVIDSIKDKFGERSIMRGSNKSE